MSATNENPLVKDLLQHTEALDLSKYRVKLVWDSYNNRDVGYWVGLNQEELDLDLVQWRDWRGKVKDGKSGLIEKEETHFMEAGGVGELDIKGTGEEEETEGRGVLEEHKADERGKEIEKHNNGIQIGKDITPETLTVHHDIIDATRCRGDLSSASVEICGSQPNLEDPLALNIFSRKTPIRKKIIELECSFPGCYRRILMKNHIMHLKKYHRVNVTELARSKCSLCRHSVYEVNRLGHMELRHPNLL